MYFQYSDEEWHAIVESAGAGSPLIDRSELELLAQCTRFSHEQANAPAIRRRRRQAIAALAAALEVFDSDEELTKQEGKGFRPGAADALEMQIRGRTAIHQHSELLHNRIRPFGYREAFIRHCIAWWTEMGFAAVRKTAGENVRWKPFARWIKACTDPVFREATGPVSKTTPRGVVPVLGETDDATIDGVVKKMRAELARTRK